MAEVRYQTALLASFSLQERFPLSFWVGLA